MAAAAGCSAVALTDHDSLTAWPRPGRRPTRLGITLVPGCEVSCRKPPPRRAGPHRRLGPRPRLLRGAGRRTPPGRAPQSPPGPGRAQRPPPGPAWKSSGSPSTTRPWWPRPAARPDRAGPISPGPSSGPGRPRTWTTPSTASWPTAGPPTSQGPVVPADVARLGPGLGRIAVLAHPLDPRSRPLGPGTAGGRAGRGRLGGLEAIYGRYTTESVGASSGWPAPGLMATGAPDYHGTFKPDLEVGTGMGDLDVPDSALEDLAARCR